MNTVLGPKEVAAALGIGERTARRLMVAGKIRSFRVGEKHLRTLRKHVVAYCDEQCERYRRQAPVTPFRDLRAA